MKTSEIDKFVGHRVKLWKRPLAEGPVWTGVIERKVVRGKKVFNHCIASFLSSIPSRLPKLSTRNMQKLATSTASLVMAFSLG